MLEQVHENDPGFIVAWHSRSKHNAGKYQEILTWGEAHREAERLEREHPENTDWAEHLPDNISRH